MKKQRKYLTEEELKRFLKGIESTRDRAIFTVFYWRGLRAAEPGQLKLSDWDRKAQRLFVHRGKGSVSGQALLSPAQSRTLEAWIRVRGVDCSRHFLNNQSRDLTRPLCLDPFVVLSARDPTRALVAPDARSFADPDHARAGGLAPGVGEHAGGRRRLKPAPDENMKQITIRVDPDLLAAISERQSVAIVAISERQSMAIVKQPRRTFAGERQAEAFIAAPRIACKLLKQRETKNRRREGTAPVGSALSPCESFMCPPIVPLLRLEVPCKLLKRLTIIGASPIL